MSGTAGKSATGQDPAEYAAIPAIPGSQGHMQMPTMPAMPSMPKVDPQTGFSTFGAHPSLSTGSTGLQQGSSSTLSGQAGAFSTGSTEPVPPTNSFPEAKQGAIQSGGPTSSSPTPQTKDPFNSAKTDPVHASHAQPGPPNLSAYGTASSHSNTAATTATDQPGSRQHRDPTQLAALADSNPTATSGTGQAGKHSAPVQAGGQPMLNPHEPASTHVHKEAHKHLHSEDDIKWTSADHSATASAPQATVGGLHTVESSNAPKASLFAEDPKYAKGLSPTTSDAASASQVAGLGLRGRDEAPVTARAHKHEDKVEGLAARPGSPAAASPGEAAVGGHAASLAPVAAAVASGTPESVAEKSLAQDPKQQAPGGPQGGSLLGTALGTAATAAAAVGQTASDLHRKYAPTALGGTGADASYDGPVRQGAGSGADPSPASVQGFDPAPGQPRDAPHREAATGGEAARLAPLAAAVAAGTPESRALNALPQETHKQPPEQQKGTEAAIPPAGSGSSGGVIESTLAAGSAAASAVGQAVVDTFSSIAPAGAGSKEEGSTAKPGLPKGAPPSEAAVGGTAATIAPVAAAVASGVPESRAKAALDQGAAEHGAADKGLLARAMDTASEVTGKYAPVGLGGSTGADARYTGPSRVGAGPGADPRPDDDVGGLHSRGAGPREAPVAEAARGGRAASLAAQAAAGAQGAVKLRRTGNRPDASQNLPQTSPLIILGVGVLLLSLFIRVPLWMWVVLLVLAGAAGLSMALVQ